MILCNSEIIIRFLKPMNQSESRQHSAFHPVFPILMAPAEALQRVAGWIWGGPKITDGSSATWICMNLLDSLVELWTSLMGHKTQKVGSHWFNLQSINQMLFRNKQKNLNLASSTSPTPALSKYYIPSLCKRPTITQYLLIHLQRHCICCKYSLCLQVLGLSLLLRVDFHRLKGWQKYDLSCVSWAQRSSSSLLFL